MAYDQHGAYEPPQRRYYGQVGPKSSNPTMYSQGNGGYGRDDGYDTQQQYDVYDDYASHTDASYPQQQNGGYDQGYDRGYDRGYERAPPPRQQLPPQQQRPQRNGYDDQGYDRDRGYDRGPPQRQQPPPHQQQRPQMNGYDAQNGPNRRAERPPTRDDPYGQAQRGPPPPQQDRGYGQGHGDRNYDPRFQPRAAPQGQPRPSNGPQQRPNGPPGPRMNGPPGQPMGGPPQGGPRPRPGPPRDGGYGNHNGEAAYPAQDRGARWPMQDERPTSRQHYQPTSPVRDQYPDQWPMADQQAPPRHADSRSPPSRGPPAGMQPIDTGLSQQRSAYAEQAIASPAASISQHSMASQPGAGYAAPKPWMNQRQGSMDSGRSVRIPTREEQIENEMPNFDSAAPGQTSGGPRRGEAIDSHLNGAADPMRRVASPYTSQTPRPYYAQADEMSRPHSEGPPIARQGPNDMTGRVMPPRSDPYNVQQNGNGRGHGAQDVAPPHAPNMDNRQIPYRPGTQGRPYQNGPPPPHSGYSEGNYANGQQQRPGYGNQQNGWPDQGPQRGASAPPERQIARPPMGMGMNGGAPPDPQRFPSDPSQPGHGTNPDALPSHPPPVRPGLAQNGPSQPAKPPPVRNYNQSPLSGAAAAQNRQSPVSQASHDRKPSVDPFAEPVTKLELDQLRNDLEANPYSNKRALIYVKKLVEASTVLANEGGRADSRTTAKNRDRYISDAYKRLKKLVSSGYPEAQFYLADCYGQGLLNLEPDTKEAFNLYQAAAKSGHAQAAYRTAVCCEIGPEEGGGTRKDFPKAVQWYKRAATLGDNAAMYKIGVILLKGLLGEQKNISEAINWLKRAAERADRDTPHALHELAALYESGNTSPEIRNKVIADDKYALELLQQAASLGYKFSQFRLGQAYEYGHLGLKIDNRLSITWYTKAAAQAEHQAELALSGWYLTGADGILEHSDTEAYLWARKAAMSEPPLAKAMFAMGYFTENGIGCPASLEEAKKWYGRAAYYKFPKALERLEEMKRNPGRAGRGASAPGGGKISRKDQKRDEAECVVM